VTAPTLGKGGVDPLPLGSNVVPSASRRRPGRCALVLALVMLLAVGCDHGGSAPPESLMDAGVVRTTAGLVRGGVAADHRLFSGIPYAASPVGPLRWQPPAPVPAWTGARDATRPGQRCIQDAANDLDPGRASSEDCLNLNVWTPPPSNELRPVLVWIHGGGFVNGSGDVYNARLLASRGDIVVVTINYRLGALGFLAHPALGPPGAVGNYGLADQQAALRWVRDNIANFGGDPAKVTIGGESAGGISVCDHLVAPGSAGLFRAAIIQSAPCQAQAPLSLAEQRSIDYAVHLGCGLWELAAQCLRGVPAGKLQEMPAYSDFGGILLTGPVSGTAVLPVDPITAFGEGRAARVPVMIGSNRDEFTVFVAVQYLKKSKDFSAERYPQLLSETFGANAAAVAEHYQLDRFDGSVPLAYSAAVTDQAFACATDRMSDDLAKTEPVFAYEFNDRGVPAPEPFQHLPFPVGASHSLELRYLFDIGVAPPLSPAQQALSDQMMDYWAAFVATGSPSVDGQPDWPAGKLMSLQPDGSRVVSSFEETHQCAFWASVKG
jgi:para-nitrobenzyl esterase